MFRLIVVLSCVAAALVSGATLGERVLGGQNAYPGQFPYQISIRHRKTGQHVCGGTLISNRHILTAAHCVYKSYVDELYIVAGATYLSEGGTTYTLDSIAYHGGWDPQTMADDVAVLTSARSILFENGVSALPLRTTEVPDGSPLILSGWGLTSWPGSGAPNTLQWTELRSININQCAAALQPGTIYQSQICTYTRPGQGSCSGDSGGPLVYDGQVAGIVSWGRPCAIGVPDVFTKVSAYVDWIQQTMQ